MTKRAPIPSIRTRASKLERGAPPHIFQAHQACAPHAARAQTSWIRTHVSDRAELSRILPAPMTKTPPNPEPAAKAGARTAPLSLWRMAEAFLHTLHTLFGAPEDVARRHTLGRTTHALMLDWLRAAEALLRRLLLIEALAHIAAPRTPTSPRPPRRRTRKLMGFTPDEPEAWRVSFRCFVGDFCGDTHARNLAGQNPTARRDACVSPQILSPDRKSAWPIAERYEALLRVFNDPAPYAQRLARRLRVKPHSAGRLLRLQKGVAALVGAETLKRLSEGCIGLRTAPDTS